LLFNSFHYIAFFLTVLLAIDTIRKGSLQHVLLLVASYYFYWASSSFHLLLLVYSSYLDFYCGRAIYRADSAGRRRLYLCLSLVGNLGVLAYFKYTNFAISTAVLGLEALGWRPNVGTLEIFLPIGISFFTFQSMSYSLDIYFGRFKPVDSLKEFALYVAFFPQLVAGPIVRAREFLPQLVTPVRLNWENLKFGSTLILYGLVKKVCIADNLSGLVQGTFYGEPTHDTLIVFLGIVAFAVQIYCDFSGYTDIAIGSARVLGFRFPDNFAHPYFSRNITEFWRRWHISLSSWLRDYLYIPLGGSRRGKRRQVISLMITMLLGGLWHGAAWHFVIWGGFHGVLLVVHKYLLAERRFLTHRLWTPMKILFTFYLTLIAWLIFIIADMSQLAFYIQKILFLDFQTAGLAALWAARPFELILLGCFFAAHLVSYKVNHLSETFAGFRPVVWTAGASASLVLLYLLAPGQQSFIYFQF